MKTVWQFKRGNKVVAEVCELTPEESQERWDSGSHDEQTWDEFFGGDYTDFFYIAMDGMQFHQLGAALAWELGRLGDEELATEDEVDAAQKALSPEMQSRLADGY